MTSSLSPTHRPFESAQTFETASLASVDGDVEKQEEDKLPQEYEEAENQPADATPPAGQRPPLDRTSTKASVNNVASIPNGGLQAWLQVLGAWILFFNSWGIVNTFGAYQTYYELGTTFQSSASDISWIGAVQAFLLMLVGALTGPIYDAGHFRILLLVGSTLIVLGQMTLSVCHEYYQVFLAQALCIGIGCGCLFVPSVAIMSTYFSTKIALAIGISATGSSIGGVIYPIVFHRLQPTLGFAWTTRIIGFIAFATLLIPLSVMKMRVRPASARKLVDWSAFRETPYLFYVLGSTIGFAGLYVPFFYIQYYAIATHITDANLGFYLLAILNSASVFGRVIPNFVADRLGGLNIMVPCGLGTAAIIFGLIAAGSVPGVVVLTVLYGFFSGTFVSLPPSIFVSLSPNRGVIGTRMGMGFSIIGVGVLVGTPIAGAILGDGDDFTGIWAFGGACTLVASVFFILARTAKVGFKVMVKA